MNAVNVCEHGDHPAPDGHRFCSAACQQCESESLGDEGCDGICGLGELDLSSVTAGQWRALANPSSCDLADASAARAGGLLKGKSRLTTRGFLVCEGLDGLIRDMSPSCRNALHEIWRQQRGRPANFSGLGSAIVKLARLRLLEAGTCVSRVTVLGQAVMDKMWGWQR